MNMLTAAPSSDKGHIMRRVSRRARNLAPT